MSMKISQCVPIAAMGVVVSGAWSADVQPELHEYAVYSAANLSISGNAQVEGHVGAGGTLSIQDDSTLSEGVYASNAISIRYRTEIGGLVHAGHTLHVSEDSILRDSAQSVNLMNLGNEVLVVGDVTSGSSITVGPDTVVQGSTNENSALPDTWTPPIVTMPSFSPGGASVFLDHQETVSLDPGSYSSVTMRISSTLQLSSGVYHFSSINSQADARFEIDDSLGPVEIYVDGDMVTGTRAVVELESEQGGNLEWFVRGSVTMQHDTQFIGMLQSFDSVTIQDGVQTSGSIYAQNGMSVGWDSVLSVADGGTTFYVATNGNDANTGFSMSAPLRTIQAGVNKCVEPGSTIYIAPGEYAGSVEVGSGVGAAAVSGATDDRTRIIADVTGVFTNRNPGSVVLQGNGSRTTGMVFTGVDNWTIENLTIDGFTQYGIRTTDSAPSIIECVFDVPTYYAVYAMVDRDFEIRGCRFDRDLSSGSSVWVSPSLGAPNPDVILTQNDCTMKGPFYLQTGFKDGWSWRQQSSSGGTTIARFSYGFIVLGYRDAFGEVEISNNQISDTLLPVLVYNKGGTEPMRVINNTVVGSYYSIYAYAYDGSSQIGVHNNIIDQCYFGLVVNARNGPSYRVTGLLEHDITYIMSSWARPFEFDVINADPQFHEPETGDFSLWSASAAVDAGAFQYAPSIDIEGRSRPVDGDGDGEAQADLGAYEQVFEGGRTQVRVVRWREVGGVSE